MLNIFIIINIVNFQFTDPFAGKCNHPIINFINNSSNNFNHTKFKFIQKRLRHPWKDLTFWVWFWPKAIFPNSVFNSILLNCSNFSNLRYWNCINFTNSLNFNFKKFNFSIGINYAILTNSFRRIVPRMEPRSSVVIKIGL